MDAKLKDFFDNVNSWVRFAESKNAALVTFNSAASFGLASLLTSVKSVPSTVRAYLCFCIIVLAFGAIAGLISFLPRLRVPCLFPKARTDESDNLLFFGHAAKHTPESYLTAFSKLLGTEAGSFSSMQKTYAEQIVVNSQIALYKYRWFAVGLWFTLTVLATPIAPAVGLIIHLAYRRKSR